MAGTAVREDIETLLVRARLLGADLEVNGSQVMVSAPDPLPDELMRQLRARKAAVLSCLAIPEERWPVVEWARWLVEHHLQDEAKVVFKEAPLRTATLQLSEVGRYATERLGSLSLLCSWEGAGGDDLKPGWRGEQIDRICAALAALQEALGPFGIADPGGKRQ